MSDECSPDRIEALYQSYGQGGQEATLDRAVTTDAIAEAFASTVSAVSGIQGIGPFHPSGSRKSLFDLQEERGPLDKALLDTEHAQALLWSPPRWPVTDHPELDFMYVAREIKPGAAVHGEKRTWVIDKSCQVSADLLLMNTADRTPIVAEFKRGGDQNADYALVQALAATAQLTPLSQRQRLQTEYSEHFGKNVPERLDVYVILTDPPPTGTRPKLFNNALSHATELAAGGKLDQWVRRIVFLEAKVEHSQLAFEVLDKPYA
jgi:hypothetical protein